MKYQMIIVPKNVLTKDKEKENEKRKYASKKIFNSISDNLKCFFWVTKNISTIFYTNIIAVIFSLFSFINCIIFINLY